MKRAILCAALCVAALSLPQKASAGWLDDWLNWLNNGGNTSGNTGGTNVPLDGGLSLLAIAGVGYGVKKYAASQKK